MLNPAEGPSKKAERLRRAAAWSLAWALGVAGAQAQAQEEGAPAPVGEATVEAAEPPVFDDPLDPGDGDPALLPTSPTLEGASGIFRVRSAQTSPELSLRLWLAGQVFSGADVVRANDEDSRFVGTLGLSASPLPFLEPYLILGARSNSNSFSTPEAVLAQGDTTLGTKAVYELSPVFHVGADIGFLFLTGAGNTTFDFEATSVRLAALATFDGTALEGGGIPVRGHLNLGYLADNSDQLLPEDAQGRKLIPTRVERFAQGLSAFSQVQLGLGVEVPLDYVTPSVEYNLGVWVGDEPAALCQNQPLLCPSEAGFGGNPQVVTLGLKGMPLPGLILSGAVDLGLTGEDVQGVPVTPPWNVLFGLAYAFDPRTREKIVIEERVVEREKLVEVKPKVGVLVGKVVDADNGKPVPGAVIEYSGAELTPQVAREGSFRSYELELSKEVELVVSAPEYKAAKIKGTPKEGGAELVVKLKPEGKLGEVALRVEDDKGQPMTGVVVLTGPKVYEVTLEGGQATQKVLYGDYTASFSAPGYLTGGQDLEVGAKGAELTVRLSRRPASTSVEVLENRVVLEGKIEFDEAALKPEAEKLLDEVAAALLERPDFTLVRVEAHVDDAGPANKRQELTQARAEAVRAYLIKKGIGEKRVEARGFGSEKSLVPNSSAVNRAINRRVEFVIVSKRAPN
jgi:outer membrane protein OmpA-like peptidoglycan-associated protein